jgi:hypothetical protein
MKNEPQKRETTCSLTATGRSEVRELTRNRRPVILSPALTPFDCFITSADHFYKHLCQYRSSITFGALSPPKPLKRENDSKS